MTEKNNQLNKDLTITKTQLNEIKSILFSNNWMLSKTFIDDNRKQKAFIIPINKGFDYIDFDEAVNYCSKFNSTLVEIQSQQKQSIF